MALFPWLWFKTQSSPCLVLSSTLHTAHPSCAGSHKRVATMRVGGGELPKGVEAPHKLQVLPPGNPRGVCGGGEAPPTMPWVLLGGG